jgi:FlaA1/EpsC-like NDP-sugar epimerase
MISTLNYFIAKLLRLPRGYKRLLVILIDVFLCAITVWLAFYLRLGEFQLYARQIIWPFAFALLFALPIFFFKGLYRTIFRYSGFSSLLLLLKAVFIYGALFALVFTVVGVEGVPRTLGLIQPVLFLLVVGASRIFAHYLLGGYHQSNGRYKLLPKVLIYGCGSAGRQLADLLTASNDVIVCGFLDDNPRLQGNTVNGLKVYDPTHFSALCQSLGIHEVLLALSAISRKRRNVILKELQHAKVVVRSLPRLIDITSGKVTVSDLHELDIDDLLERQTVEPQLNLLSLHVESKVVMVTGAGGSIGSELCRQIVQLSPVALLLIEHSEFALYELHQKLLLNLNNMSIMGQDISNIKLVPLLGSVRNADRMRDVIHSWKPHIIYHTAAYKHVPLVEHNPIEGIWNNVFGTLTTATVAAEEGVKHFVLVSTDKAVRPTNVMGASKRLAEMVLQAIGGNFPNTQFSMVRFGNVLGSSGSVVPKFRQEIRDGGPIHLTHLEVMRYFMTISEAAQLVMQAGAIACGGEVFILNMGEPVKILDLARRMVELSGLTLKDDLNPDGDIEIELTGLRSGEKLYEELLIGTNPEPTSHPLIMKATEAFLPWPELSEKLEILRTFLDAGDVISIKTLLRELVSGYTPDQDIKD